MHVNHPPFIRSLCVAIVCVFGFAPSFARAQVTAPSVYTTAIQVQGEAPGAEFADWAASGITVIDMDPADNAGGPPFIDIGNVQIANDDTYIYIHATLHAGPTSLANLFLAFDTDQTVATGFDPFALGVVGSELGYQTDFPFGQATGVFNTEATITGGPFGNGGALIYPFWTEAGAPQGSEMEWAVPLNVTVNGTQPFSDDSFDFAIWTDNGLGDITQRISYTLAPPPAGQPGDFNGDGVVDAADYPAWRKLDNTPAGYDEFFENFGEGGGGAGAVPEPAAIYLLIVAAFGLVHLRP
jgi:hypothetical protein